MAEHDPEFAALELLDAFMGADMGAEIE